MIKYKFRQYKTMSKLVKIFIVIFILIIGLYLNMLWNGLFFLFIILAILVYYTIKLYNDLVAERNGVRNAWSKIDVQLNKRADLIENLVETVKGYATHEKSTFIETMAARKGLLESKTVPEIQKSNQQLTQSLMDLYAVAENYPELKANKNFMHLQAELKQIEDNIAAYREQYNNQVYIYNNSCEQFPNNLVASMFHFNTAHFLEVDESKKELPKVKF